MRVSSLIVVLISALTPLIADAAAPSVTLRTQYTSKASRLKFTITPQSTAIGCNFEVFGAFSNSALNRSISNQSPLLTVKGTAAKRVVSVSTLPKLKSSQPSNVLFSKVRTRCGAETAVSKVLRTTIDKSSSTTAVTASSLLATLKGKLLAATVTIERVFASVDLEAPLDLQPTNDGTGRLLVAELEGKIKVLFPTGDTATSATFIDISSKLTTGGEQGLLGLALHPNFSSNGFFFVNYTRSSDGATVIARYQVSGGDANAGDIASEQILLTVTQPFANHNGGGLAFGKDGFLYIGLGDGGGGGDPLGNGQDRTSLLGKFLRIDVDTTEGSLNYGIPDNNPFVGNGSGFREEIFAYGFRNPFRFSVDSETGKIYVGDVGQDDFEEVDILESGKNYGWNTMEGKSCYNARSCNKTGLTLPIAEYPHTVGHSITGGYVYRGTAVPGLVGRYVYGDFIDGVIFGLEAEKPSIKAVKLASSDLNIASFGVDEDQELYLLSYAEGAIYKFKER